MVAFFIFLFLLFSLIIVHEAGHFFAARPFGIRVEEFGIGFPPRLWSFVRNSIRYSVNLLPFGGFVRIYGEDGGDKDHPDSFVAKSFGIRLAVLGAGVFMNWTIAVLLLSLVLLLGRPAPVADTLDAKDAFVQLSAVAPQSPAQAATLHPGDKIISLNSQGEELAPTQVGEMQEFIKRHAGSLVSVTVKRGGNIFTISVVPRAAPPEGQGPLGVALVRIALQTFPWYEIPWRAGFLAASSTITIAQGLGTLAKDLFAGRNVLDQVAGPVGLVVLTGDVAGYGVSYLIYFAALISINLAMLNVLPFPALDGGRAFLLTVEQIIRRPLPKKIVEPLNAAGLGILFLVLIVITVHELEKYHQQLFKSFFQ